MTTHKRLVAHVAGIVCMASAFVATPAESASVYANWLTVNTISYYAGPRFWQVSFNGTISTVEVDDFGSPCDDYTSIVIKADSVGVPTTQEAAEEMIRELQIARALGLRVRVWVHKCAAANNGSTRPKAYIIQSRP